MDDVTAGSGRRTSRFHPVWTGRGIGVAVIHSGVSSQQSTSPRRPGVSRVEIPGELHPRNGDRGRLRPRHPRRRHRRQPRRQLDRPELYADLPRHRARSESGLAERARPLRHRARQRRDRRHRPRPTVEIDLQHPRHQSFAGPSGVESYTIDPSVPAVEAAWKAGIVVVVAAGNEAGTTRRTPRLRHHLVAGQRSLRDYGGRHEDQGHAGPASTT